MRATILAVLVSAHLLFGCRSKPALSPSVIRLQKMLATAEENLTTLDIKTKDADFDRGLKQNLAADKEMAISRLERLRERLRLERGTSAPEEDSQKPAAAGHH